ncbi:S-adenosyl-L-methionine-dependent methyltransferase [Aulographum hederae CBS 113979]|uniref:S-adenosyl-L-methionine-dependent methyltransferase n=1 Tax=Aulographum hederae CBS 113979 TaxID=1176131 RepID=A0A6G1GU16_9PEZI|nr:S-adenosyl-L-methionine-dependent methyltransferase [Aulographum hederae CBS 113979]
MATPTPKEKTFTSFTPAQGSNYARNRPGYHPNLFKTILTHHTSTGGALTTLLDVGCGPGSATFALAPSFTSATGIDPSEGMITTARTLSPSAENTSSTPPIRFEVSSAEDLGAHLDPPIADASVDLITAATAAHWFDMAGFYAAAARVLKPDGTIALWSTGRTRMDPSLPNGEAIQAAIDEIEDRELGPFMEQGNLLTRNNYVGLGLPWTVEPPVEQFLEKDFVRKDYAPETSEEEFFMGGSMEVNLDTFEKIIGTMSPVQRWREAHKEDVGTKRDVVKMMRSTMERLLHEAGVEEGKEVVRGSLRGVLLMFKKI